MKSLNKKISRLAIIPARLGSKRIKKKNIKLFNGKPMISYPIKQLKKSKIFNKIFVSTEANLIKKISEKFGANVDFLRPKKLSKDNVSVNLVLKHVVYEFEKRGEIYDEIWLIYACNPLLRKSDIINAKNNFLKTNQIYPLVSMKEFEVPIEWGFERDGIVYNSINKKKLFKDSKKIKKKYFDCASFVIYKRSHLLAPKNHFKYYGYLMENHKAVDIDSIKDWKHALKLHKLIT